MSDTEDKSANQVPTTKKSHSSKRQGKSSRQAHQDKFRAKKNESFLERKMKQLDKSLYLTPDVDKIFTSLQISTVSKATELPVTSRGIGLLTLEACKKAQLLKAPPPNTTIFSVYRASLAQFGAKVIMCRRFKTTPLHSRPQMDLPFEEQHLSLILGQQQNFSCIATAINQLGSTQVGETKYVIELPANTLPMLVDNRRCQPAIANVDGAPQPVCHPQGDIERAGFGPNPYLVTLSNLRATVLLLADPQTPQASRQYFYDHNPLPGSVWNVGLQGPVLTNPDQIIPNAYNRAILEDDLRGLVSWNELLKKHQFANAEISFNEKGSPAVLVNVSTTMHIEGESVYDDGNTMFESRTTIPPGAFGMGALALFGEHPAIFTPHPLVDVYPDRDFGIRYLGDGTGILPVEWNELLRSLLRS